MFLNKQHFLIFQLLHFRVIKLIKSVLNSQFKTNLPKTVGT